MKVGDYVRTDDGLIGKVVSEPYEYKDSIGCDIDFGNNDIYNEYELYQIIIKSSPNIIDLIEIGDIVNYEQLNGGVVLNKKDDSIDTWSILPNSLKNEDIKSVITKEQLKECMYEVGDKE